MIAIYTAIYTIVNRFDKIFQMSREQIWVRSMVCQDGMESGPMNETHTPRKSIMSPEKSTVGRSISCSNSPFLGGVMHITCIRDRKVIGNVSGMTLWKRLQILLMEELDLANELRFGRLNPIILGTSR